MWYLIPFVLFASVASFWLKIKSCETFDLFQNMTVGDFDGNGPKRCKNKLNRKYCLKNHIEIHDLRMKYFLETLNVFQREETITSKSRNVNYFSICQNETVKTI